MEKKIVFLCGARDFHAMDWYRSAEEILPKENLSLLTDLIAGEGFKKIVTDDDHIEKLLILDKILFRGQSKLGNLWRNIIKFLVMPVQVFLLKKHFKKNPKSIYYAHSMYYLWLGYLAKVNFIGTPQGSDILIKPFKSKIYMYFSKKSLKAAKFITVDSDKMKEKCYEISLVTPYIIQNGIDLKSILEYKKEITFLEESIKREKIISIRGFTELYRIKEILQNRGDLKIPITFIYPFYDSIYKNNLSKYLSDLDKDLGRVDRSKMYELLHKSLLIVSIPSSDSSPRSVYEAVFCGSPVCISYHPYYDSLPLCMKKRLILVDLDHPNWFNFAVEKAEDIIKDKYFPSEEALDLFDQRRSFNRIINLIEENAG
tara:strand:+ start:697 stop:1809 length:1113 start_codon:yes stop_codon:yes gene_type:complete